MSKTFEDLNIMHFFAGSITEVYSTVLTDFVLLDSRSPKKVFTRKFMLEVVLVLVFVVG